MVEVEPVMDLDLMILAWFAQCSASDGTSAFCWNTTSVVSEVVHVVLLPLLFQLSKTCFSIAARSWS